MKKCVVLLLVLFLCACQNVSVGSSSASSMTSSVRSSSASAMSLDSDTEEPEYQDEIKTIYETEKYIYIFEQRFASVQDPTNPPQFTGILKRQDENSGNETIVWQEQNFTVRFLAQYGDDIYFGLGDFREFTPFARGFMYIADNADKMITVDAVNICAMTDELIFCGKNIPDGDDVKTILQVYSMKDRKIIGAWDDIIVSYSDYDFEFEYIDGILIWEGIDCWNHFDYKTGVNTITKEE